MLSKKWNHISRFIYESELVEDIEELKEEMRQIYASANQRIKEIINRAEIQNKLNTRSETTPEKRRDYLLEFLTEEIFPHEEQEYKTKDIYDKYKEWCKNIEGYSPYGKNKFYDIMRLEPGVVFEHRSYGDYFIFKHYRKDISIDGSFPF